jgi:tetratricopeptide (TPR) repeat protein
MVLGKCYLQKKQYDQAEKEFKRVLLFDPKHLAANKHFGDLMRQMGWDNACESSYRKILKIDPLDKTAQAVLDELSHAPARPAPGVEPPSRPSAPTLAVEPEPPRISLPPEEPFEEPPRFVGIETPTAATPFDEHDLLADTGFEEERLLNALPPEAPEAPPPPSPPPASSRRAMDEDKFASILDDIFQDEVIDDRDRTERPPHLEPQKQERDFEREFGFDERLQKQPAPMPQAPPSATPPSARPPEDFDDDIFGPPQPPRREEAPAFTANLSDEEMPPPMGTGNLDFMEIEGLEPEPPEDAGRSDELPPARLPDMSRIQPTARRSSATEPGSALEPSPLPAGQDRRGSMSAREREKIVTTTLGEIYAAQGQFAKAIGVFELLLRKDPNNRAYRDKIEYLKKRLQETEHAG